MASRLDRPTWRRGAGLALALAVLYLLNVFPVMPPVGDAADYAALIRGGEFGVRTIHIGYYVIAFPFVRAGAWLGLSPILTLNILAAVTMTAAILSAYGVYLRLGIAPHVAMLAAAVLGTTSIIWYHAEFGEVQALLLLLLFGGFYAFSSDRPLVAGALYGIALLVTQAAAFSAPVFVWLAWRQRRVWPLVWAGVAGALTFALGVAPIFDDFFFGPRGAITSMGYYPAGSPWKMLLYFCYRLIENYDLLLPFLGLGAAVAWRRQRELLVLALFLWLPHAWVNLRIGHVEYGFAWMPVYLITAVLVAIGLNATGDWLADRLGSHRARAAIGTLFALSLVVSYALYVAPKRRWAVEFTRFAGEVQEHVRDATVVAASHHGFAYVAATRPEVSNVWESTWRHVPPDPGSWDRLVAEAGDPLYLLDARPPAHPFRRWLFDNPLSRRLLSADRIEQFQSDAYEDPRGSLPPERLEARTVLERGGLVLYRLMPR